MAAKITRKSKERKKKGTRYCPLVTIWWDMGRYGKIWGEEQEEQPTLRQRTGAVRAG